MLMSKYFPKILKSFKSNYLAILDNFSCRNLYESKKNTNFLLLLPYIIEIYSSEVLDKTSTLLY